MRSSRELKALIIQPRTCRSETIMASILSERPQIGIFAKSFILRVYDVLARHSISEVPTFFVSMPLLVFAWFYLIGWLLDRWRHKGEHSEDRL